MTVLVKGCKSLNPNGRPKGVVNKFTQIKHDFFKIWEEENCLEKLRYYINTKDGWKHCLNIYAQLVPKEIKTNGVGNSIFIVKWDDTKGLDAGKDDTNTIQADGFTKDVAQRQA